MCRLKPYLVLIDRYHGHQAAFDTGGELPEENELKRLFELKMKLLKQPRKK